MNWLDVAIEVDGAGEGIDNEGSLLGMEPIESSKGAICGPPSRFEGDVGESPGGAGTGTACRHSKRTSTPPVLMTKEEVELSNQPL